MWKKILLVMFIAALLPFKMNAEWLSIDKKTTTQTPPNVTLISDDDKSAIIKIDISGFEITNFVTDGRTYQSVDLLTDIFSGIVGSPAVPQIAKILAIPNYGGISVEILETGEVQTFKNIVLAPARSSWFEGQPESAYQENNAAYRSDDIFPAEYASVEAPSVFRDFRIARVSVNPVRYIAAKNELQVVSSITVKINYGRGEVINPKTSPQRAIAPSFGKIYRSTIFNYEQVLDSRYDGREDGRDLMLCIMPDEFVTSFQVYADWKRRSGTDIHITQFSDIGANSSNPDIIKAHISDAYLNWENPPTYVCIVGDAGIFPIKTVTYPDYSFPSEDFFVEIEGNDFFPEMMIGRFTNQGDYRMQVMINKFLLYEQNPYTAETDWFKHGTACSNNAYESQVSTVRFASLVQIQDGGFVVDTLMSDGTGWGGQGCSMNTQDVVNTINEGRGFLNYRGEGWYSGWSASCYDFNTSDVTSLNNGQKFTFVTSIGCGVAGFQSSGGNCFGEDWVQLGSLTAPRGGVAFIGPGSNTHTTYNNKIDKGIYVGMFREGMDTPGQALMRGKLYMYNVFGADYYCEYHYKIFHILGDPSVHIWKEVPLAVNVNHLATMPVGNDEFEVTTTFASSGLPVANAEVCVAGNELFFTAISDADGKVNIIMTPESEETLTVTVRGGNVIPYQGTLVITQPEELVEPEGFPVITDLDGNTDGLVNPNENCTITFTLKNWGVIPVNNVQATISSADTNVQVVTTNPVSFGNLNPGGVYTGAPFQFYVKPYCPIGHVIQLQLHVTSTASAWDYNHNTQVVGCQLTYNNYVVHEIGTTNINYRMDPGETVELFISVGNIGLDVAPNVMGILSSNDQYITIEDETGDFGTLNISSDAVNVDDYFVVAVDASCPTGYMAEYSLKLYTQDGNYPYQMITGIYLPVGLPVPTDYTGPDPYGYYAYSNTDAFFDQTPVYDWFEIDGLGTEMNVPLLTDYTSTVNLPFSFKYYGTNYNQVRISTDGWFAFGGGTQIAPVNTSLPNNDNVNNMVAVFWDDLYDITLFDAQILYYNDEANHRFIIEWDSISHNGFTAEPIKETFQAILLDPAHYGTTTGDGEIILQYKHAEEINSNTVGIENSSQMVGLQYVFNENYNPTAAELSNQFAIKFTTEAPFVSMIVGVDEDFGFNPNKNGYRLEQNFPNPFSSETSISYTLPEQSNVALTIYNVRGEVIRTLYSGQQQAGRYSTVWNGISDNGTRVSAGVYFYRLQTEGYVEAMKLFMLK